MPAPLFHIALKHQHNERITSIAIYSITAVGPLSQLNRHIVGATNYAKEFDGTRILNILTEAFLQSWSDVSPTLTWAQLPAGTTWESYDATNQALVDNLIANVDVPGQYELQAYSGGEIDAYTLTTQAANSGRGVLWEGGDGDLQSQKATQMPKCRLAYQELA